MIIYLVCIQRQLYNIVTLLSFQTPLTMCALLGFFVLQDGGFSKDKWTKIALLYSAPVVNAVLGYFSGGTLFYKTSSKFE